MLVWAVGLNHSDIIDSLDEEIISITRRWREHNNHRHDIVLEQTGRRRMEGPIAGPDLGERKYTLTAKLLHD